jgi:carboxymethylenebutenolidase
MKHVNKIKSFLFVITFLMSVQVVAAESEDIISTNGKYIRLKTASEQLFTVYVAGSVDAKQGILLLPGWWGLNAEIELWADQYAAKGYRVMAVDLYDCHITTNPATARKLMSSVVQAEANAKYAAALKRLSEGGRKIAVMGRSYGGSQALYAALTAPQTVAATVIYYPYGELPSDEKSLAAIKAPVLAHFAKKDFFLTPEKVEQFNSLVKQSGLKVTVNQYDARHGFDKPSGKNFDDAAHRVAQDRTAEFLKKYLN